MNILLISLQSINQQPAASKKDLLEYLNSLSLLANQWIDNPETNNNKKQLSALINKSEEIKLCLEKYIILKETKHEKEYLELLLKNENKESIIKELILWKYQSNKSPSYIVIEDFNLIISEIKNIMIILNSEEDYNDAFRVISAKEALDNHVFPLINSVKDKL